MSTSANSGNRIARRAFEPRTALAKSVAFDEDMSIAGLMAGVDRESA